MWAQLSLTLLLATSVLAQLPLPTTPWLPPDKSIGARPSNGSYPNAHWSTLLGNALYFYEAQRSGELPSTKRVPWRNASALDDGREARVDLTGERALFSTATTRLTGASKAGTTMLEVRLYVQQSTRSESLTVPPDYSKQTYPLVRSLQSTSLSPLTTITGVRPHLYLLGSNRLRKRCGQTTAFLRRLLTLTGQGYDLANQTAYLDDMLRWGLTWLMKVTYN